MNRLLISMNTLDKTLEILLKTHRHLLLKTLNKRLLNIKLLKIIWEL